MTKAITYSVFLADVLDGYSSGDVVVAHCGLTNPLQHNLPLKEVYNFTLSVGHRGFTSARCYLR